LASAESDDYQGTMAPQQALDFGRLEEWLQGHVVGFRGPIQIEQFKGGQSNPTYKLTSPSGAYALRRKPAGPLLPSAHAVEREYRVLAALAGSGVPVAQVHGLCEDATVIGSAFYVMDFVDGRIFWDQRLPGLTPAERARIFDSLNEAIANLHRIDPAVVGLADFGRPGNYMDRQIARWSKQYLASETQELPAMRRLIDWLPRRLPLADETRIVHGDYRMDNVIFHPSLPRVAAILDWELSTLGNPIADFAYHAMSWRVSPELFRGLAGADLLSLGIPDERAYVEAYCRRTGRSRIDDWEFYVVFGMFRLAAILQGIAKRAIEGTAASAQAAEVGSRARPIAEMAWSLAQSI
jgi:aminoglycoside phosphotransferase (APT) family kinase protein